MVDVLVKADIQGKVMVDNLVIKKEVTLDVQDKIFSEEVDVYQDSSYDDITSV